MVVDVAPPAQELPDAVVRLVGEFAAMAAGIPWSDDILDGLLACVDGGGLDLPALETRTERITGVINVHERQRTKADASCSPKKYLLVKVCLRARLHGGLGQPDFLDNHFSFDRTGLKQAIEWLQQHVNRLQRQGLCRRCMAYNEPPLKRLCVPLRGEDRYVRRLCPCQGSMRVEIVSGAHVRPSD